MRKLIAVFAVVVIVVCGAFAQAKVIGMKRARQIALQRVKGKIKSAELEKEHGKLIYSFDIRNARGRITEVNLNARTGKVVAVVAETAKDEAKEKADERKEKKKP